MMTQQDPREKWDMVGSLMKASIVLTIALAILWGSNSYGETGACSVATSITVNNLRYRMLAPTPDDSDRLGRAFEEFDLIHSLCPTEKIHLSAEDCVGMKETSKGLESVPAESFEKVTGCRLRLPSQSSSQKQTDIGITDCTNPRTGESCWVIRLQSARCWTAFSITGMFSSAAREVGEPSWARRSNSPGTDK
jgi:hypothetical protein